MNNHRLLTGLLSAALLSGGVRSYGQTVTTLEHIFEVAEANSAQLRPYFTAQDEAQKEISVARSERLPEISASLSVSYIGDGFTTKRNFTDYQKAPIPHFGNGLSLNLSQPIYTGGAIKNNVELAELKSTAARYAAEFQRDNIRFQLTGFYLDIYKYGNLRTVVENNIAQARKVLAEMTARYQQGVALQNDITRYELLVSNLELQLVRINNTLDILNRNLVVTAGLPEGTVVVPDPMILSRSLPSESEGWWQQEATENAPSLKMARTGVDLSRKAESLVKSNLLPKVGLKAAWLIDGPILVEVPPINRNLSYWYVGLGVSYDISSLYKANKSLSKSRTATRQAIDRLEAARENVGLGIRADYVRYLEAYEELKTQQKSVELAERNYRTTSTRYSADMALITDMLDAANSKIDAEQQLVNARINIIYYYYKLLFTSGKI
ncbi:TolC family protein [Duncaniella sp.]|uniref:TolC family protein n=1 Tax=Duncaniella sp. TaxID=2518496 RepID=UPI0023C6A431|nr:TolC family protein [Duncaniella sp.]MDE5905604.1 TolC family protein [Duncaniella sp.]